MISAFETFTLLYINVDSIFELDMSVSSPIETKGPIFESFILTFLPMKTGWVTLTLSDFRNYDYHQE